VANAFGVAVPELLDSHATSRDLEAEPLNSHREAPAIAPSFSFFSEPF
jgi:hypothetical protein